MLSKKINIETKIPRSFAPRIFRLYKLSQKLWNGFISFAQLNYLDNDLRKVSRKLGQKQKYLNRNSCPYFIIL